MPTLTVDLTAPQAQRLSVAFGKFYNFKDANESPRPATIGEIEFFLRSELRKIVQIQERQDAEAAIVVGDF